MCYSIVEMIVELISTMGIVCRSVVCCEIIDDDRANDLQREDLSLDRCSDPNLEVKMRVSKMDNESNRKMR